MRLKAFAKLLRKRPMGDPGYLEDDPGFTNEELDRITEITGIERTIATDVLNFQAIILNHYYDDPITKKMIKLLEEEMGRTIYYSDLVIPKYGVTISLTKEFEAVDFENAVGFSFNAAKEIGELVMPKYWQDETGCPFIKSSVKSGIGGLVGGPGFAHRVFCDQMVKEEMESASFVGLNFVECELVGRSKKDIQLYEISSEIVLPRTSNSFSGGKKSPHIEYSDEGTCLISEESFPRQLAYNREAIGSFPNFDVGITHEKFGFNVAGKSPSRFRFPMLVVSPKFRDWCLNRKYSKLEFCPINMEPETNQ